MPTVASAQAYDGWYSHYSNGYSSPWCSSYCPLSPPAPEADGFTMQAGTASEYLWGEGAPSLGFPPWIESMYLWQPGVQLQLFVQTDCNVVLYDGFNANWALYADEIVPDWMKVWPEPLRCYLRMQGDGNLVYNVGKLGLAWHNAWNSQTQGHPGAYFVLQTDGNLVVYDVNGSPLWSLRNEYTNAWHDLR